MSQATINALVQLGIALLAAIPPTLYAWAAYKQGQAAAAKAAAAAEIAKETHELVKNHNGKT